MCWEGLDPAHYRDIIAEAVEPWTYLKFPYYKAQNGLNGDDLPTEITIRRACTALGRWPA